MLTWISALKFADNEFASQCPTLRLSEKDSPTVIRMPCAHTTHMISHLKVVICLRPLYDDGEYNKD